MARITMKNAEKVSFTQIFELYISAVTARGVKDKTLVTYKQHFHAISKRLDVSMPIHKLSSSALDKMILQMRQEGLSDSSINSYTRTLKCFLSWCNEEGYTKINLKIYKAAETVKETYTDEELLTLLKKPEPDCKFCEYRNWVIINFLLNSGLSGCHCPQHSESGCRSEPKADYSQAHKERQSSGHPPLFYDGVYFA